MLVISTGQQTELSAGMRRAFEERTGAYLARSFPEMPAEDRHRLLSQGLADAGRRGIATEYGLFAYAALSFVAGAPLGSDPDFVRLHARAVSEGHDADEAVIRLYESAYRWAP